jgi:hypothetical protein
MNVLERLKIIFTFFKFFTFVVRRCLLSTINTSTKAIRDRMDHDLDRALGGPG